MSHTVYIGIGSNIGDREKYLQQALVQLNKHEEVSVTNISSIYETDPVGYTNQAAFLNMAAELKTELPPLELLNVLQKIEHHLNRKREIHWGPRTIDLDILLYNDENIESEKLKIPHPHMYERAFVLIPLYEVNSNLILKTVNQPIGEIITELPDKEGVRLWKKNNGVGEFGLLES
ncbi:2-amino-4-hydroxy-6-hydroxymethyldihydropteridine diphosphokinase [Bacillus taeanensis]|uniref:2-amino-4-hydroxy-6-hydroxymethyldihydropteridine diphosphokinase n=1 Tax=Bacillus taeanensis TaxID=273032 RepID=A0A366XU37_9BACI|nr:2-amino-4-hydroxy-6-hydroxymethyldihydropteridine diphosphokinase [Bacillus taeanensis]RBW67663.1 2-amino-4-hydroxy-6-hydroxymethyldihydropteridine diphosphokinase [Bacillus taeanensis]